MIIKQSNFKMILEENKGKEQESIAYVIYSDYFSAVLALKVLNSTPEKERIIRAKLCVKSPSSAHDKPATEPTLYMYGVENMILEVENVHISVKLRNTNLGPSFRTTSLSGPLGWTSAIATSRSRNAYWECRGAISSGSTTSVISPSASKMRTNSLRWRTYSSS